MLLKIFIKKIILAFLFFFAVFNFQSCKESDKGTADCSTSFKVNSSINTKISLLNEKLASATEKEKSKIYSDISLLYSVKGDFKSSLENAEMSIKSDPENSDAHYCKGKSCFNLRQYNKSIHELEEAIRLGLNTSDVHFELGSNYYKKKNYRKASIEYKMSLEKDPENIEAINNYAVIMSKLGKNREAEKYLLQSIKTNPDFILSYKNLGILYDRKIKNSKKAVFYYKEYFNRISVGSEKRIVYSWIKNLGGNI